MVSCYLAFGIERDTAACTEDAEAEEDVRVADGTAHAADVQHGVRGTRHRQSTEHHGDCRRDAGREQGDAEAVWEDRH